MLEYSWDPAKSAANLRLRGFDFEFAARIFEEFTVQREDSRRDYGERRILAVGSVEEIELTLCFTDRYRTGGVLTRRIISARRSNHHERQTFREAVEGR
jgi:hypothetical protein